MLSSFCSICQVVTPGRLKTKENFKVLAMKVVTVAYERWLLTRVSKYSDITFGILKNWLPRKGGPLHEVVVTRGSTVITYTSHIWGFYDKCAVVLIQTSIMCRNTLD